MKNCDGDRHYHDSDIDTDVDKVIRIDDLFDLVKL